MYSSGERKDNEENSHTKWKTTLTPRTVSRHQQSSVCSSERLPSLKPKRDLTLGGVPKRVFTPTIPVRRPKNESSDDRMGKRQATPTSRSESHYRDGKSRRDEQRDKRKERKKRDIVASASVFSMGPAEKMMTDNRVSGSLTSSRVGKSAMTDSTLNKVTKDQVKTRHILSSGDEEEEMTSGDQRDTLFPHSLLPPVQLPLERSLHNKSTREIKPLVRVKSEPLSDDEVMETDKPHLVHKPVKPDKQSGKTTHPITTAELFTPSEGSKGQFLFFQLPDCLPLQREEHSMEVEGEKEDTEKSSLPLNSLRNIPEGVIGRLQVHESGNVTLLLGDTTLNVAMGTRGGFLQEVVSIRTSDKDSAPPSISVLGHLSYRLVCTPDIESLLHNER